MSIQFKHVDGSKSGQVDSFDQDRIRIGRQADNDLRFDPERDISVSGYHAEFYRDGDAYFVKDLQSRNGTFLNSRKIDQPVPLKEGDVVQFSPKGPKIVFSTANDSLRNGTMVMEAESLKAASTPETDEKSNLPKQRS